jgi:hypothetical protein
MGIPVQVDGRLMRCLSFSSSLYEKCPGTDEVAKPTHVFLMLIKKIN